MPIDTSIASNNSPPTGTGTYRLPTDLEPIVQGVLEELNTLRRTGAITAILTDYSRALQQSSAVPLPLALT